MALLNDIVQVIHCQITRPLFLSGLTLLSVLVLYQFFRSKRPDLSHIPILGAELGYEGRKAEYGRNPTQFLQRGYEEVRASPAEKWPQADLILG